MLKKILSRDTCAKCRICCAFDRYDVWETPVFTSETAELAKKINPDIKLSKIGNGFKLVINEIDEDELFYCPMLDKDKGCLMGDDKPFDCRVWPFRIMKFKGVRVITISPVCNALFSHPLSELVEFMKENIIEPMFDYADSFPAAVKPYDRMYPILYVEDESP